MKKLSDLPDGFYWIEVRNPSVEVENPNKQSYYLSKFKNVDGTFQVCQISTTGQCFQSYLPPNLDDYPVSAFSRIGKVGDQGTITWVYELNGLKLIEKVCYPDGSMEKRLENLEKSFDELVHRLEFVTFENKRKV